MGGLGNSGGMSDGSAGCVAVRWGRRRRSWNARESKVRLRGEWLRRRTRSRRCMGRPATTFSGAGEAPSRKRDGEAYSRWFADAKEFWRHTLCLALQPPAPRPRRACASVAHPLFHVRLRQDRAVFGASVAGLLLPLPIPYTRMGRGDQAQNGFTITRMTMSTMSTVGISLIMRQWRAETVLRSSAKARTAIEK